MPRKSDGGLKIYVPGERPPPPPELTAEQATVWTMTVDCMPASWLSAEMYPLMVGYCRSVSYAQEIATWLNEHPLAAADKASRGQYRFMLSSYLSLEKQIASVATKMRLSPQSRYLPKYASESKSRREADAGLRSGRRPWELPYTDEPGNA